MCPFWFCFKQPGCLVLTVPTFPIKTLSCSSHHAIPEALCNIKEFLAAILFIFLKSQKKKYVKQNAALMFHDWLSFQTCMGNTCAGLNDIVT